MLEIFEQLMSLEGQEQLFTELMQERSLDGYTPFMAAVTFKVRVKSEMLNTPPHSCDDGWCMARDWL